MGRFAQINYLYMYIHTGKSASTLADLIQEWSRAMLKLGPERWTHPTLRDVHCKPVISLLLHPIFCTSKCMAMVLVLCLEFDIYTVAYIVIYFYCILSKLFAVEIVLVTHTFFTIMLTLHFLKTISECCARYFFIINFSPRSDTVPNNRNEACMFKSLQTSQHSFSYFEKFRFFKTTE